jgi:hypothetical protein
MKDSEQKIKKPKILLYYEPKRVPEMDNDGNIIGYKNPAAFALPLSQSNLLREKTAPAELGLSADPENVQGFRATLDMINSYRNVKSDCFEVFGCDDLSVVERYSHFVEHEQK